MAPLVEPPQARPAETEAQTGAPGAKQQAPVYPLGPSVQLWKVDPGKAPHAEAVVAPAQVGAGGQFIVQPLGEQSSEQAPPPPAAARQIGAPGSKQQVAV